MMKVSVIMPVYNMENYLKQAIDSFLEQTIEEKELICINDGSTDKSIDILREYAVQYTEIIVLDQKNQGAGAARNKGISIARGEFLAFLDADDFYLDETALEVLYRTAKNKNLDIVGGYLSIFNGKEKREDTFFRNIYANKKEAVIDYLEFQLDYHYQCFIFKRGLIQNNKITFPLLRRYQDPPFMVKAMYISRFFALVPIEFYCYRVERTKSFFSDQVTCDLYQGIKMNMEFAECYGLKKLYDVTLSRLKREHFKHIYRSIQSGNVKLRDEILADKNLFDIDIFFEWGQDISAEQAYKLVGIQEQIKRLLKRKSKVVICGVGKYGVQCAEYLLCTGYAEIVCLIDKEKKGQLINGKKVCDYSVIKDLAYDVVLIAVKNDLVAEDILNDLKENVDGEANIVKLFEA